MSRTPPTRVVVIGAGVAGLAAAGRLREAGIETVLIEAGPRIGGRAHTIPFAGAPFDTGASWLHDADCNPLAALATPADHLRRSDPARHERLSLDSHPATADDQAALDRLSAAVDALRPVPGRTLAELLLPFADDPFLPLVALWEGAVIAAADADRIGSEDWHLNRLDGHNDVPQDGVGAFVARTLATEATLSTPATAIDWSGPGVVVETPRGTIHADAAIVTVSTGVLRAGTIRFAPALPAAVAEAIDALPMGLLSKVAHATTVRFGLPADSLVMDRDGRMTFNAFGQDRPHLVGFFGGDLAWSLAHDDRAAAALFRAEWWRAMGRGAALPGPPLVTHWGTDPLFLGSYAYAGPGDCGQRRVLADSFPAERLIFAGEATRSDGLAGTVGGAYRSGMEAAGRLINAVPAAAPAGSP